LQYYHELIDALINQEYTKLLCIHLNKNNTSGKQMALDYKLRI